MTGVSAEIKALYDTQYADGAERGWRAAGAKDKVDNLARALASVPGTSFRDMVEIGCGDGALAHELSARGLFDSYRGFDVSPSGVQEALSRRLPGASFVLTEGGHVPVPDDSADLVVMSHVVEHLEHPRVLLNEARRIAEHALIEVPLELNARMPRDYRVDALGHINKYTAASIRQLVQSCNFDVLCQFSTNPPHALYNDRSGRRRLEWAAKNVSLQVMPRLARTVFVYHETLLLRRSNRTP